MIQIENLKFSYSKRQILFQNLDLQCQEGSVIGLLGKNGAGKSTFLRILAGLLKPQEGIVLVSNETPFKRCPACLERFFFVPEELTIPSASVVGYAKTVGALYPKFDEDKLFGILKEFEVDANGKFQNMSYGQKKKFMIAFALSTNCELLLLDEPTNGLDIPSKALFRKVLAGALSDDQIVLISTHQVKDVENLIDRILLIDRGQIIYNQSVLDVVDKYAFHTVSSIGENEIYYERSPGGFRVLKEKNGVETPLDIELLFNAVTHGAKL